MAVVRQHRPADRQDLLPILDAHVNVHAVDQHLPAPPLRTVDQRRVALFVSHLLVIPSSKGVRAGAHQLDPQRVGDDTDLLDCPLKVGARVGDRPADARHDLHCVEQQLLTNVGVLAATRRGHCVKNRLRDLTQVARIGVDEGQLPLDTDRRPPRLGERDLHGFILPEWAAARVFARTGA